MYRINKNKPFSDHKIDQYCLNYLLQIIFTRYSYTISNFNGTWGYQPMRVPYKPYHENKNTSNYCEIYYPNDCLSYCHLISQKKNKR